MILFIDIEHEKILQDPARRDDHLAGLMDIKLRLEEIADEPCLVVRYDRVRVEKLASLGIRCLIISGNATDWEEYPAGAFDPLYEIIHAADIPILGICGGHQLIAMAFGITCGPIRPLDQDEEDVTDLSAPGYYKEWGFLPIELEQEDPLLEALGASPIFLEAHYWEVKELPAESTLLASRPTCRVQIMRHRDRPIYGVQFHPEAYTEWEGDMRSRLVRLVYGNHFPGIFPAGKKLLRNFLRIAGVALNG